MNTVQQERIDKIAEAIVQIDEQIMHAQRHGHNYLEFAYIEGKKHLRDLLATAKEEAYR